MSVYLGLTHEFNAGRLRAILSSGQAVVLHRLAIKLRDEFLSEEDLDLRSMTEDELYTYWDLWLRQAQITNDQDRHVYTHGVFVSPEAGAMVGRPSPMAGPVARPS